jgi:hypothetical protein
MGVYRCPNHEKTVLVEKGPWFDDVYCWCSECKKFVNGIRHTDTDFSNIKPIHCPDGLYVCLRCWRASPIPIVMFCGCKDDKIIEIPPEHLRIIASIKKERLGPQRRKKGIN